MKINIIAFFFLNIQNTTGIKDEELLNRNELKRNHHLNKAIHKINS
jgi:hypothetical protein